MRKGLLTWLKIGLFLLLAILVGSFFYFESSTLLRIIILFFGVSALLYFRSSLEYLVFLAIYLSFFGFYNLHYGLGIPLALLMVLVLTISYFLLYCQTKIEEKKFNISRDHLEIFYWVISLVILEFFLSLDFWPIDPMTKALILTIIFFLGTKIFYLHANHVLNFRRASGYIYTALFLIVLVILLNLKWGF